MDNLDKQMNELNELKNLMEQLESFNTNEDFDVSNINVGDFKIQTSFTNNSNNTDPEYAKVGDSGFDLRAFISEPITLKPLERKLVPTGLRFELPSNTELQVRPRSGMALKYGISVLNTPGTIDSDYRGEIKVIIYNHGDYDFVINNGDRIAQMVLSPVIRIELEEVKDLPKTIRGEGGFGSTGK